MFRIVAVALVNPRWLLMGSKAIAELFDEKGDRFAM
jgi:hypothetical protein